MKIQNLIQENLANFSIQHTNSLLNLDVDVLQVITSYNQTCIPHALCILLSYDKLEDIHDECIYFVPNELYVQYNSEHFCGYNPEDLETLILKISNALLDTQRYAEGIFAIQQCLRHEDDLNQIAMALYDYFHNPLVFVDESFKSIALSPNKKTGCIPFDLFLNHDYPEQYYIQSGKNIDEFNQFQLDSPQFSCFKPLEVIIISAPILEGGHCIGGFSLFEVNERLTQTEVHLVEYLMLSLSNKAVIQNMKSQNNRNSFLQRLLFQNSTALVETLKQAESFGYLPLDQYCLLNALIPSQYRFTYEVFIQNIQILLPNSHYCVYENSIIFLIPYSDVPSIQEDKLEKLAQSEQTTLVINNYPVPLKQLSLSYQSTKELIDKCISNKFGFYKTLDYFPRLILQHLSLNKEDSINKIPYVKSLFDLEEYDKKHQTEYLLTLETYLSHFSLIETSKALIIHRNTLLYRLHKIEEITSFPLSTTQDRINLLFAFEIYRTLTPKS